MSIYCCDPFPRERVESWYGRTKMAILIGQRSHDLCTLIPDQYQVNVLKKLRSINIDYHQVGWYQSTYLSSHITKDFLESHQRYQQAIQESVVLIYGEQRSLFCCLGNQLQWNLPKYRTFVHNFHYLGSD